MRSKQRSKGHSVTRGKSVRMVAARAAFGRNVPEFGARPDWRRLAAVGFVVSLAPFATMPAFAANCTFTPAAGNWNLAGNWSCGVIPSGPTNDNATINIGSTVTIDTAQSIDALANAGLININAFLLELQGGATTNTGTINVGAGPIPNNAALNIGGGHNVNNTGGTINVSADSVVNQFGSTITGGTINTTGTGRLVAANSGANFLSGVTLNGTLDLASAIGIERILGGLTLNGRVDIGAGSTFAPQGNQTIGGNGAIVFADANAGNRFNVEQGNLVLGSGITVRGNTGRIGAQSFDGGASTLRNDGTISADVAGGTITLAINGLTTNNGTLSALNGGTLLLNSAVTGGAGSEIIAGAGSTVVQNGVTLAGDLTINGVGTFRASNSSGNIFNGVSFTGTLDLASQLGVERVIGGLSLDNATISIGSGSTFAPEGNQTIGGTGTILFADDNAGNRFNVEQGNLVLGSGITVRGDTGRIGAQSFNGGASTLTNDGTISADVAGGTITLAVNGLTTNNGTLSALNGGTLVLSSSVAGGGGWQPDPGGRGQHRAAERRHAVGRPHHQWRGQVQRVEQHRQHPEWRVACGRAGPLDGAGFRARARRPFARQRNHLHR